MPPMRDIASARRGTSASVREAGAVAVAGLTVLRQPLRHRSPSGLRPRVLAEHSRRVVARVAGVQRMLWAPAE